MSRHDQVLKNVLCIDVGDNTGWAYWGRSTTPELPGPMEWGQFSVKKGGTLEEDLDALGSYFNSMLKRITTNDIASIPTLCILEGVSIWAGSLTSMTSAKRGNLFKLAYLVGRYTGILHGWGIAYRIILAQEWKGQMKDDMVKMRVERITGYTFKKSEQHTADAIGIGLAQMGYFTRTPKKQQRTRRYKV